MFGKHVFRSIKKEPVQPLMIIMIVSLCVAVIILSVALPLNIRQNERMSKQIDEWSGDLLITLKSSSNVRLMFKEDFESALEGKAIALGEFTLTGFSQLNEDDEERSQVHMGAFDLVEADRFYELRYIQYGRITNNNLNKAAIIRESFAKANDLRVGDTIDVTVMGEDFSFVVEGIVKDTGIFLQEHMLVDISSVRNVLSEASPLIAAIPEDYKPYTKIHVKVNDGVDIEALRAELESLDEFADKKIDVVADVSTKDYITDILIKTILIPASLLIIVAVMMMMSTLELLEKKREGDIALFKMVGADRRHLECILYLEGLVYSVIGGAGGSVLAIPAMYLLNWNYKFSYCKMRFGLFEILIGFGSAILFTMTSTFLHVRKQNKKRKESVSFKETVGNDRYFVKDIILASITVLLLVISLILPTKHRFVTAALLLVSVVTMIYTVAPRIIGALADVLAQLVLAKNKIYGKLLIALRSCRNSYPLRHAGRIMVVLLTMLLSMVFILTRVRLALEAYTGLASFDYVGMYVDEETKDMVKDLDGIVATAESVINRNVSIDGSIYTLGIAMDGDVGECFQGLIMPKTIPEGNSLALSSPLAKLLGVEIGDTISCVVDGTPNEFVLTEIVDTYSDFAYYDAEYANAGLDMFCILTDGSSETREALISLFDERGAMLMTEGEFFDDTYDRINPQITVILAMLYIIIAITVVGIFDVLADQRMARKREFEVLKQNGATEKEVVLIQTIEIIYLAVCAVLGAALCSILICRIIDMLCVSFGITLYP